MDQFRCPFCNLPIRGAGPAARAFVFNVVTRRVVPESDQLRAGDVLVVVDSTIHPEDHAIHRCDDPQGKMIYNWFRHRAMESYSAINSAIRKDIERSLPLTV